MKILHTGDIHFKGDLLEEIAKCTNHLLKTVKEASPDVVVLAGDLFDERQTYDSQTFLAAMDFVRRLSGHSPVLIVKGTPSHDGHTLEFLRSERVYVSESPEQVVLTKDRTLESYAGGPLSRAKALFSCLPSVSKAGVLSVMGGDLNGSNFNTVELMRDVLAGWGESNATIKASGVPVILVGHLSVMGATLSTGQQMVGREVELGVGDLRMARADLVCLGHIHKAQNWSEVFYCGSLTRLNFGEEEE
ncbi:MAG: exonuclease SbcCD subunit D, partial [bacterium]